MAQYPSQPAGFEEGPKNPLKGTTVKSLVPAAYAQFGVGAGGRRGSPRVCDGRAPSNGMEDPTLPPWRPAVVHRRTPPVVKRPVYEADDEPAMRCYPALPP